MHPTLELLGSRVLETSVQTGVLVLIVWLLCRYTRALSASAQCVLWWLVALQSLIGLVWAAPLQLPLLPAVGAAATPLVPMSTDAGVTTSVTTVVSLPAVNSEWSWGIALIGVWLVGVAVGGVRTVAALRRSRYQLRVAQPCFDEEVQSELARALVACRVRRAPRLMLSSRIDSPQLIGPWRPVLILPLHPLQRMDREQLRMALDHELIHLRRHDLWLGLVPALVKHLFFFHPMVHLAVREYAITREAAVDAEVVADDRHCRHHYGRLLLQLGVGSRPPAGLASASPTFISLKRRLLMLQETSSSSRLGTWLILTAVVLLGVTPMRLVAKPEPVQAANAVSTVTASADAETPADGNDQDMASPVPQASNGYRSREYESITLSGDDLNGEMHGTGDSHVLIYKDKLLLSDSSPDLSRVEALGKELLWVRRDGREYVIRDVMLLERFQALYADSIRMGFEYARVQEKSRLLKAQSSGSGSPSREQVAQEVELDKKQAELGRLQAAASARANRDAEQLIREAISSGIAQPLGG